MSLPGEFQKPSFLKRRVLLPFLGFLKQGTSPEKLALCVALGMVLGIVPALGVTTILCILVAFVLRLNQPAMQLVNHLVYPVQLVLIIPFMKAGNLVFSSNPSSSFTAGVFFHAVKNDPALAVASFWQSSIYGLLIWLVAAPVIAIPAYWISLRIFQRWKTTLLPAGSRKG